MENNLELNDNLRMIQRQVKESNEKLIANQENCTHIKPNGRPAVGGQKLGVENPHYIFVCAYCQKEFDEITLPEHLRLLPEMVGYPYESRAMKPEEAEAWHNEEQYFNSRVKSLPPPVPAEEIEAAIRHVDETLRRLKEGNEL